MRIGSIFSGIGGLEHGINGLEPDSLGQIVYQVEADPFCRRVLAKHWPHVPRFDDVRTVGAHNLPPADLVVGGFPCTDLSAAGKQEGLHAPRSGLWWEMRRIIDETRPALVVVENVFHSWRSYLPELRRSLWAVGYSSVPIRVRASDVGALHRRSRLFVVAYVDGEGQLQCRRPIGAEWRRAGDRGVRIAAHTHLARLEVCGQLARDPEPINGSAVERGDPGHPPWTNARPSLPVVVRGVHGLSGRLDRRGRVPDRPARIRALGNSVVPPAAAVIGHVIRELFTERGDVM